MESVVNKFEAERAELDSLLNSEAFARGGNVTKVLGFICEKYFEGSTVDVTEYDIAVHALGRAADFDSQIDTIVRVTTHLLRKRLEQYYRTEGADHSLRIYLPYGRYVPKFVRKGEAKTENLQRGPRELSDATENGTGPADSTRVSELQRAPLGSERSDLAWEPSKEKLASVEIKQPNEKTRRVAIWTAVAMLLLCLCTIVVIAWFVRARSFNSRLPVQAGALPSSQAGASGDTVRALLGERRAAYVDTAGQVWASDTACSGGSTASVPFRTIAGTQDPQIFLGERLGLFHCVFPVPAGTYEVHLLFAETSNLDESARLIHLSMNGNALPALDVVLDSGGDNIATEKIFTDIHPGEDGRIHIDATTVDSFLNAVEILPGTPNRMLPLRIYTGHTSYRDSANRLWLPNRYFFGGRLSQYPADTSKLPDGPLYATPWTGYFRYVIPVAHGETYRVKLHFRESLFGPQGVGWGVGSRVFDVWCNGTVVLKDFDLFKKAGSEPLTEVVSSVEPTGQDKIEIEFLPKVSYAFVDAIEVIPEPDAN